MLESLGKRCLLESLGMNAGASSYSDLFITEIIK